MISQKLGASYIEDRTVIRLAALTLELKVKEKRKEGCTADLFLPPDDHFEDTTEHKTSSNSNKEVS
jgi:hypothetical protein